MKTLSLLLREVEALRRSPCLLIFTNTTEQFAYPFKHSTIETIQNHLNLLVHNKQKQGKLPTISLVTSIAGGNFFAISGLISLLQELCETLEVIIPKHTISAASLLPLAANNILMNEHSTIGSLCISDPLFAHSNSLFKDYSDLNKFFCDKNISTDEKVTRLTALLESTPACIIGRVIKGGQAVYSIIQNYLESQHITPKKIEELLQLIVDTSQKRNISAFEAIKIGLPIELSNPLLDSKLSQLQSHTDQLLSPIQTHLSISWGLFCIASTFGGVDLFFSTATFDPTNRSMRNPPLISHRHFS